MSMISVQVLATKGSAPRDAGTVMCVSANESFGTIGGGALEYRAIQTARNMLDRGESEREETLPLGPSLGQCCGGSVSLRFSKGQAQVDRPRHLQLDPQLLAQVQAAPLWIWGAGHVGRAVVNSLQGTSAFDITWIDRDRTRFPAELPVGPKILPASNMPRLTGFAPGDAHHLIFTYSHDIDLALCAGLLKRGFASCGLIGSATKWARFQRRLRASGLNPAPVTCPIGDPPFGKHPDEIAHSTLTALLRRIAAEMDSAEKESAA